MPPLKIIFMGTPSFSVPILDAIHQSDHEICAVYSQPPRPAGRGHKFQMSAVHTRALELGLPVLTPVHFKELSDQQQFRDHQADMAVVVAYGLILKTPILESPWLGCINIHASLLPRWRGAAPIQRAIMAGDQETGITIMQMDEGLDTGHMIKCEKVAIEEHMTTLELHDKLSAVGARTIVKTLDEFQNGPLPATPQPLEGITYAHKLHREESMLNWAESAVILERKVRALNPWPGTSFVYNNEIIKVLKAEVVPIDLTGNPGTVIDDQLTILCADQVFRPLILQKPGKAPLPLEAFLRGNPIAAGTQLPISIDPNVSL